MGVARIGESRSADSGHPDAKRLDRNLIELLNELRVTGVFGSAAALVAGPISAAVIASLWFVIPLARR
jgi:hypothetical protein